MLGIFLDTETNGLNPFKHRILEIAFKIIDISTGLLKAQYTSCICIPLQDWEKSDPESLKVNGFTFAKTEEGKSLEKVSEEISSIFQELEIKRGGAVFICQNPSFDRVFFSQIIDADTQEKLRWPYYWLDLASMYWAESIRKGRESPQHFPWFTGFSKDKIANAYNLPPEGYPHLAMNGVNHLVLCYEKVIGYPAKEFHVID